MIQEASAKTVHHFRAHEMRSSNIVTVLSKGSLSVFFFLRGFVRFTTLGGDSGSILDLQCFRVVTQE